MDSSDPELAATVRRSQAVAARLVGKTERVAAVEAERSGRVFRVGERDGARFVFRLDYRPTRLTVAIERGVVVRAEVG